MINQPKKMILIGFLLLLVGVVGPFLMILNIVPASFFLSFLSHGSSVVGLLLGMLGAFSWAGTNRK